MQFYASAVSSRGRWPNRRTTYDFGKRLAAAGCDARLLEVYMQFSKIKSCVLSVALIAMTMPALGQGSNKQVPDPQQQPQQEPQTQTPSSETSPGSQSTSTPTSTQPAEQSFQGKISESGGSYVLKDSSGTTYQLDDQKKAKDFSGQSVKVTGNLDSSTNMIRVSSISPAS